MIEAARGEIRNPLDPVVQRAVQLARAPFSGAGQAAVPSPPQVMTLEAGDGTTIHPLIWGVDDWGDAHSVWTED